MQDFRDDLNKQNNTDNPKRVRNRIANGNIAIKRICFANGFLCCCKCRRTGQRTGKQSNAHGRIDVWNKQRNGCTNQTSGNNDNATQCHIGLCILFQVLKEARPCNQSNRGYKQNQPQVLHQLKIVIDCRQAFLPRGNVLKCNALEMSGKQCNQKDCSRAQRYALDGNFSDQVADNNNCKDEKQDQRHCFHAENMRSGNLQKFKLHACVLLFCFS